MRKLITISLIGILFFTSCKKNDTAVTTAPSTTTTTTTTNSPVAKFGKMTFKINGTTWTSGLADTTSASASATANKSTDHGNLMTIVGKYYNATTKFTESMTVYTPMFTGVGIYHIKMYTNAVIDPTPVAYYYYQNSSVYYSSDGADTSSVLTITEYDQIKLTIKGTFHFSAFNGNAKTGISEGAFYVKTNY